MRRILFLTLFVAALPARAETVTADVVVYGGTASGIVAAVAVAREGCSVALVEPSRHLGGMVTGGLGATDTGVRAAIGGYSREFFQRVRAAYVRKYGPDAPQVKECSDGFHFEPHVATAVFDDMLREAKIVPRLGQHLKAVTLDGQRLVAFETESGDRFQGAVFIDASYEGDLMARAGVPYHVGREGRVQYGESLAGVQAHSRAHQWSVAVSALGAATERPLPFVQTGSAGEPGAGDRKLQAYNFRLCMTDRKDNAVPFPKPDNYDPARYELLARYLAAKPGLKVGQLMNPVRMPNGKTDTNNNGPFSTDHIGANWDYPEADRATRERIRKDHVDYVQGFLYFLANDPRVPPTLQREMNSWGLAKDEFTATNNWPPQLYVREARRMLGAYVMTQADVMERRTKDDSVGLGSYNTDSHHVQRVVGRNGAALNEGDFQEGVQPYAIPYRSLVPKAGACPNLLVPVCMSASHVAYGTVRMEPVYMILGHASGVAAALSLEGKTPVQLVSAERLRERLMAQKAVLSPEGLSRPGRRGLDMAKLPGVVVDDGQAQATGSWVRSTSSEPFVGVGYLHDNNEDKGQKRVRFVPKLVKAGRYEVRFYYPPHANRAAKVPVVIRTPEGERTVPVDQRKPPQGGGPLVLGTFAFEAGDAAWVEVRTEGTEGFVVADAVQFVLAEK